MFGFGPNDGQIMDPISPWGREGAPVHLNGYQPTWVYRAPPAINTAAQMVYDTFGAVPFDVSGPGDVPLLQRCMFQRPGVAMAAFVTNGLPSTAGGVYAAPLTFQPIAVNPSSTMYPSG